MPTIFSKYPKKFVTAVKERQYEKVERMLIKGGIDVNRLAEKVWFDDSNSDTPLIYASYHGDTTLVTLLLKYGADVNKEDTEGVTPLQCAAYNGNTETVVTLIQYKADVNKGTSIGWTPLHLAAFNGHTETVVTLIQYKADVNKGTSIGWTPLHWAACNGHTEIVVTLIQYKANVNKGDSTGLTPLYRAALKGHNETVVTLIQYKADVNKGSSEGWTPLHGAAHNGHTETVVTLIQYKADVNKGDSTGGTPLHCAALNGYTETALKLLQIGADATLVSIDNETAQQLATTEGHHLTAEAIQHYATVTESKNNDVLIQAITRDISEINIDNTNSSKSADSVGPNPDQLVSETTVIDRTEHVSMVCDDNPSATASGSVPEVTSRTSPTTTSCQKPAVDQRLDLASLGYKVKFAPIWYKEDSKVYIQEVKVTSDNGLCRNIGVPYKRIDDPNQHLELGPALPTINLQICPSTPNEIIGRPTEQELDSLAKDIGFEWNRIALYLGISSGGIQQIQMSFSYDGRRQVFEMLLQWRRSVQDMSETDRLEKLRQALRVVQKNDLANGKELAD